MTYKIEHLYPTPIYRSVVDNYKNINEKIDTFINDVEFCTPSGWGSTLFLTPLEGNVLKIYGTAYMAIGLFINNINEAITIILDMYKKGKINFISLLIKNKL